ncbi:hypothetical protein AAFF_G00109720 [Aldrovandia affinis]|uniref:Absent in melanoma 1 protein n=1 Tax=Aldrovandia affinis TaxID=143900 RepID=A0AAD7RTV2_9TELE|nr:hypothetical protein AAFF_G00109720 [Aldrovandia affinis]
MDVFPSPPERRGLRTAVESPGEGQGQGISIVSTPGVGQAPSENSSSVVGRNSTSQNNATGQRNVKHLKPASSFSSFRKSECTVRNQPPQVRLEETHVCSSQCEADTSQQIIQISVKKHFPLVSKAFKTESSTAELTELKKHPLSPIAGGDSPCAALAGLSHSSRSSAQPVSDLSSEEGDPEAMGRRTSGRRRSRKNSQGDRGSSQDSVPSKAPPEGLGSPEPGSPQDLGEEPTDSPVHVTPVSVAAEDAYAPEGGADSHWRPREGEESPNEKPRPSREVSPDRLERRTETAESKRRSIKFSHTEKVFPKKVFVTSDTSPEGDSSMKEGLKKKLVKNYGTAKKSEMIIPLNLTKEMSEIKPAQTARKVADKISLFEGRATMQTKSYHAAQSVDGPQNPARKFAQKGKVELNTDFPSTGKAGRKPRSTDSESDSDGRQLRKEEQKKTQEPNGSSKQKEHATAQPTSPTASKNKIDVKTGEETERKTREKTASKIGKETERRPGSDLAETVCLNGELNPPLESTKEEALFPTDPVKDTKMISVPVEIKESISSYRSPVNKRLSPPDRFSVGQDAPSSWLDVDSRFSGQKQKSPKSSLIPSTSENNLLDTSDEFEDFIENIKKLGVPFSFPLKKHSDLKVLSPPFALPAIKEDRFEKNFDAKEFQFGLKKPVSQKGQTPGMIMKQRNTVQSPERPKRAGAEGSMLFRSLQRPPRLLRATEEGEKEPEKVTSRLERISILSGLIGSSASKGRPVDPADSTLSSAMPSGEVPEPIHPVPLPHLGWDKDLPNPPPSQGPAPSPPLSSCSDGQQLESLGKYFPQEPWKTQLLPGVDLEALKVRPLIIFSIRS